MPVGGVLGLAWFILVVGPSILNPTDLSRFMQGDAAQHMLGWLFFRNEKWLLPLGSVPGFPYPVGTTVGYTDSIPWIAVVAKVFSPFLPEDFQYIGPWLGLCFFLQGWFGVKIVQELSPKPLIQILGGACFILDPVLIGRIGHDSLCAHWLILGLIWLHLRPWPEGERQVRMLTIMLGFCVLSAGIHPYLATMVLALSFALLCKLHWVDHRLSRRQMAVWGAGVCAGTLGVFSIFGYIGSGISWGANGFGHHSADLLTLVNPAGASQFLPSLPVAEGQYEGFGYVGGGVLLFSFIGMAIMCYNPMGLRGRSLTPWVPLSVCAILCAVFALSFKVTVSGMPILMLSHVYGPFIEIFSPFRASGRFIWPLHYLWITGTVALWITLSQSSRLVLYTVFVAIAAIQFIDINGLFLRWYHEPNRGQRTITFQNQDWQHVDGLYKHMVLYPPQILGGTLPGCVMPGFEQDYYVPLAVQAYRLKLTFNSGYFARIDENKGRMYCKALHEQIESGHFENDTIYIIHSQYWDLIKIHVPKISCGQLSSYIVCVSSLQHDAFRDFLEQRKIE